VSPVWATKKPCHDSRAIASAEQYTALPLAACSARHSSRLLVLPPLTASGSADTLSFRRKRVVEADRRRRDARAAAGGLDPRICPTSGSAGVSLPGGSRQRPRSSRATRASAASRQRRITPRSPDVIPLRRAGASASGRSGDAEERSCKSAAGQLASNVVYFNSADSGALCVSPKFRLAVVRGGTFRLQL
jgi:hypothetical protein